MILHAYTDGASRGNPGAGGIGIMVKDAEKRTLFALSAYIGTATNNTAEYTALLTLLQAVQQVACSRLVIHSDSELMVRQVTGRYKVKDQGLKDFHRRVVKAMHELPFQVELLHIPRTENAEADRLANEGIDARTPLPAFPPAWALDRGADTEV